MSYLTGVRTFGELLDKRGNYAHTHCSTCRFCGSWNSPNIKYSVRSSVCVDCCEKRRDEVLPVIVTAEKKARAMLKDGTTPPYNAKWLSRLSGATVEFCEQIIAEQPK